MIDSSSWTLPKSESGGCQLGILEAFLEDKTKWPRNNWFWAMSLLVNHIETLFWDLTRFNKINPHVFRFKESNNDEIEVVCMTRIKMAAI